MKYLFVPAFILLFFQGSDGQNSIRDLRSYSQTSNPKELADTVKKPWKLGGLISLNLSQGSQSNWASGGDDFSFAANGLFNGFAYLTSGKNIWDNSLSMAYGYFNTTSLGGRKSEDLYDLTSKYGYQAAKKWYYTGLVDFRSQFSNGYLYSSNAPPQFNSAALSPAYLLVSIGMEYKANDSFSIFLSPATARTTLVANDSLSFYGKYGVKPGTHSLFEFGAFASLTYIAALGPMVTYTTRLDLFSNYLKDPQDIDLYFTNLFSAKLGKWLMASLSLNFIYDHNILFPDSGGGMGPRLQFQELTAVGLSWKF
ncbi:MAG TPA: DUF3078 domain-containing protein [Chitinophagaceae bacterium]|nr:DUF3078 domain-containing protein [Chitinophagaceae bacterium]